MRFTVFDVGHGFCALLVADNGNVVLFDCGHDPAGFRPSVDLPKFGCTGIEHLLVTHYDEDHVSDFADLFEALPVTCIHGNPTLSPSDIRYLKTLDSQPIGPGLRALLATLDTYRPPFFQPQLANVTWQRFWVTYPAFDGVNNLSVVSFVRHPRVIILIPGDIEAAGWAALLDREDCQQHLQSVNVFVTSHHGRSTGCYAPVFDHCHPDIFITSDTYKQYSTQEQRYDQYAGGVLFGEVRRKVLTTRTHGHITIDSWVDTNGYNVTYGGGLDAHFPGAF